jgi:hypothetical protein
MAAVRRSITFSFLFRVEILLTLMGVVDPMEKVATRNCVPPISMVMTTLIGEIITWRQAGLCPGRRGSHGDG